VAYVLSVKLEFLTRLYVIASAKAGGTCFSVIQRIFTPLFNASCHDSCRVKSHCVDSRQGVEISIFSLVPSIVFFILLTRASFFGTKIN
jgi:hypothetical protein